LTGEVRVLVLGIFLLTGLEREWFNQYPIPEDLSFFQGKIAIFKHDLPKKGMW